ncbi:MAG: glycosyltransferase family 2 protein [Prevotellaceae bacterium]|nr:glycosyltransferase family 2 protein [Prevotellaceae bacterium]MDY3364887.1 glycosyltransferase family 2 protein [Prevotella sp.]
MIKISVITCTYNAARELQRTVDSVLEQSYAKVEHLIIDGQSKDATIDIARRYKNESDEAGQGHEVVLLSESDNGLYHAMNKALRMVTGDYLVYLNAGDIFPSDNTLEMVADSVGEDETLPAVLYGDTDIVDDEGRFLRHRRLAPPKHLTWRSFRQGMLVCHQAFYARTDIARQNPYDLTYRFSADVDWCIRVMKEAERQNLALRYVNEVVCHYLDGGMTVKNHRASLKERFHIMCRHYGWLSTIIMHAWFAIRK